MARDGQHRDRQPVARTAALTPSEMLGNFQCAYDLDGDGDADNDDILQLIGDIDAGCP